jgi:predicted transcriptional regulator YdeE
MKRGKRMNNENIVCLPEMKIAGIDVLTSNAQEFSSAGKIPALWDRFFSQNILDKIPEKKNGMSLIAAYTDIETDENGPYRFVIGAEVSSFDNLPEDYYRLSVPKAYYAERITEEGSFSTVGIECWKKIWADDALRKRRSYETDLEIYDLEHFSVQETRFSIYVGVKV